jgi:hypothetical protein
MTVPRAWALFTGSAHPSNGLTSHSHAGFTVGAIK